jgi:hypothetical protein
MLVALLATLPAHAQDDQETHPVEVAPSDKKTTTAFFIESEYHSYDNLDFRPLDESSDQSILDSDDRDQFAFTGIDAEIAHKATEDLTITVAASHRGLWGSDQIGEVNRFGGFVYVTALSADWTPIGDPKNRSNPLRLSVGRQFLNIGGVAPRDYVLSDIVDAVRLDVPFGKVGHLTAIPFSVVSAAGDNANANFIDFVGQSPPTMFGFRGDHLTRRYGGILVLDGLAKGLDLRAHGFFTDIAALGTGADISYDGMLGNFTDNDWVANYGLRGGYQSGAFGAWAAFGGGILIDTSEDDTGPGLDLSYWEALGPTYRDNGLQYSHGYVSMKGDHIGGLITNRFLGWHPSAYVGTMGVDDDENDPDRKAGTRVLHGGAFLEMQGPLRFDVDGWWMQDTGITQLKQSDLDTIVPPYGYSRGEFAAEERLGKPLGAEVDGKITWTVNNNLSMWANGGALLPGSFYAVKIQRVAGDQLGGTSTAWAWNLGTSVQF